MRARHTATFTASLAPRQSLALMLVTLAGVAALSFALASVAEGADAVVTWCQRYVVAATAKSGAFAVAASTVVAGFAAIAVVRVAAFAWTEFRAARRMAADARVRAVPTPSRVHQALTAERIEVPCAVVRDDAPYALTVGLLRPRILLSTGFLRALTLSELRAVMRHEACHARLRHPLRAVAWEAFRRAFFFLPSVGDVTAHFSLLRELAADRDARIGGTSARALASALLKAVRIGTALRPLPAHAAPFGHLHARIAAIAERGRGTELRLSAGRATVTALATVLVAAAYAAVGTSAALAQSPPNGGSCVITPMSLPMSAVSVSPYFSIMVPQMSTDPPGPSASSAVQSVEKAR